MPVHNWTRVAAGIFHDFHLEWIAENKHALNRKLKGTDYYAMAEQVTGGRLPDVLTLQRSTQGPEPRRQTARKTGRGVAVTDSPPKVRFHIRSGAKWYAKVKKSVTVRYVSDHRVVAILEILSPGNKSSRRAAGELRRKTRDLLAAGINVALVDVFPPTARDPQGIHPVVWGEGDGGVFRFDAAEPLTCASYVGGDVTEAFVEPFALGGSLPDLPLFLTPTENVTVPLEATYLAAFEEVPEFWREAVALP